MPPNRKFAYRYLLYWAVVEARNLGSQATCGGLGQIPQRLTAAEGAFKRNEAVHNLAYYSALDFVGFDDERFWRDIGSCGEKTTQHWKSLWEDQLTRYKAPDTER
ncbi:hypothetical protein [Armatimonas sp.]|uniref:hypothetical protein n=1 Tax=Armatimonas sp. TaxID=1872638 RepID=UPI00286B3A4C|nr:hypothetical protein [Armatimonas sp.]